MTPRVFAAAFSILWLGALSAYGAPAGVLDIILFAISVTAAYVVALNFAYRAINLGFVTNRG